MSSRAFAGLHENVPLQYDCFRRTPRSDFRFMVEVKMQSTRKNWKWPCALAAGAMLLAGCQVVAQTSPTGVYKPRATTTVRVYRTADGKVFRTRAERDAYLAALERARQREIQAAQSRRGVKILSRAEERAARRAEALERERRRLKRLERERRLAKEAALRLQRKQQKKLERERRRAAAEAEALRQDRARLARAERERRRAEAAELARLRAEADVRAARRAQRQAEREASRSGSSVRIGRDPNLAEREARRQARQAQREADQARRAERLARQEARVKERERAAREKRRQANDLPPRPRFVYNTYNATLTKHRQRQAFYRKHRRPGESEAVFWSRPAY